MNNPISDFTDELEEAGKDIVKIAKKQIVGEKKEPQKAEMPDQKDPVTGLPPVKKKVTLTNLTKATAELRMAKLKKLREELEKQRLKTLDKKAELAPIESSKSKGQGPAMVEGAEREPKDDAVANTLKGSKDTGEF